MNNVSNLGLANGFVQGFSLMNNYQAGKESRERADKAFKHQESEWARADAGRIAQAMYEGVMSDNIDPEIAKQFEAKTGHINWTDFIDPEYGQSLATMGKVLSGQGSVNTPEGIAAVNRIYDKEIKRGVGEKVGDKVIVDKQVNRVIPSKDGKSFMLNLGVKEEDAEKGWSVRNAPVTGPNRSANDTEVKQIPLEQALSDLKGKTMIYEAIQKSPKLVSLIRQRAARLGAQLPEAEKRYGDIEQVQGLGMVQQGPNGQINVLKPEEKGIKTTVIKGRLVNSETGEEIADYSEEEKQEPIKINGQLIDPVTYEVIGDYRDSDKKGGGSGSGIDSTSTGKIESIAKTFHGTFNPDGSFLGIPEGSREKYLESMKRAEAFMGAGYPLFASAYFANLSTLDPLTIEEASKLAEREAGDKDIKGDAKGTYINNRAVQLMEQQNKAHDIYNNLFTPDEEPGQVEQEQGLSIDSNQSPQENTSAKARQATPDDEQKLKSLLQKAGANQQAIQKIKEYYISEFGTLPKGM